MGEGRVGKEKTHPMSRKLDFPLDDWHVSKNFSAASRGLPDQLVPALARSRWSRAPAWQKETRNSSRHNEEPQRNHLFHGRVQRILMLECHY